MLSITVKAHGTLTPAIENYHSGKAFIARGEKVNWSLLSFHKVHLIPSLSQSVGWIGMVLPVSFVTEFALLPLAVDLKP